MKKLIKFKKINIFAPLFFFLGFFCHSRAGGNPDLITENLDSRRSLPSVKTGGGNDRGNANKFKRLVLPAVILCLTLPIITFAFVRGQDGYNYYNYDQNTSIGGNIFGGGSFGGSGGSLYCSGGSSYPTFCSVINFFLRLISSSIPILISISVIVFVWGVFRYVMAEGEDRQKSRDVMMYGIIGLFVMVSVWGLVALVYNTFGLGNNNNSLYYYGSGGYGSGSGSNNTGSGSGFNGSGDSAVDSGSNDTSGSDNSGSPFGLPSINLSPTDLSLPPIDTSIK